MAIKGLFPQTAKPARELLLQEIQSSRPSKLGGIGVILRARAVERMIDAGIHVISEFLSRIMHRFFGPYRVASNAKIVLRIISENGRMDVFKTLRWRGPTVDDGSVQLGDRRCQHEAPPSAPPETNRGYLAGIDIRVLLQIREGGPQILHGQIWCKLIDGLQRLSGRLRRAKT